MLERDMEGLLADYPDDFFPGRGFELIGRQQSFAGVGRFDLLFEDRHKTRILMEVKAGSAKYDVATQLAKYKDELRNRGESNILMWLVAPQITNSVREFLDRIGIEYSEIHLVEFRRIAERHGALISPEVSGPIENVKANPGRKSRKVRMSGGEGIVGTSREFIKRTVHLIWDEKRTWVTRDELAARLIKQEWAIERLDTDGVSGNADRLERVGNWIDWFSSQYKRGMYGLAEEFDREHINGYWAYRPKQAT